MTEILANTGLQNIYVPLPFTAHLLFCIIATAVYALEVYRKKSIHYIFIAAGVDATLLMQFFPNSTMVVVLAVMEVLLLGTAITLSVLHIRKLKAEKAQQAKTAQEISVPERVEADDTADPDRTGEDKEDEENEDSDT